MHVNSALQLNCHSRVLSQSGAERSESMIEAERKTETTTETKTRQVKSADNNRIGKIERCIQGDGRESVLEHSCT